MPGNTSMAVAPAAGAGEPGSGSGETARHAAPRGAGRPSYELLSKYRGVLMGVQILLIMAFHYTEDLSNAADHFNGPAQVFYDYIGSSGVDMFLMISGLGLYYSWKRNPDAGAFYRKRLTRVLVPYVAVALVGWIWFDFVHSDAGVVRFLADIAFVTFFTDGVKWFWYIAVCLICYVCCFRSCSPSWTVPETSPRHGCERWHCVRPRCWSRWRCTGSRRLSTTTSI